MTGCGVFVGLGESKSWSTCFGEKESGHSTCKEVATYFLCENNEMVGSAWPVISILEQINFVRAEMV